MRHMLAFSLAALFVALAPAALATAPKIGVVDVEYVVMQSKRGQAAKAKLKQLFSRKQKALNARQDKLLAMKKRIEHPSDIDSPERRKKNVAAYRHGLLKLQEDFVKNQKLLQKKEAALMQPILNHLERVIHEVAKKHGYDIILNRDQQGVIFAKAKYDITRQVLKALDAKR